MSTTPVLFLWLITAALLLFNLIFLVNIFLTRRRLKEIRTWPSTQGIISASTLQPRGRRRIEHPAVRYSYQVGERGFESENIAAGPAIRGRVARALVERYKTGSRVTVYYNPRNHADSVLQQEAPGLRALWNVLGMLDLLVGAAILLGWWLQRPG